MAKMLENLKVGIDEDLAEKLAWLVPNYSAYRIRRQSVDARQKHAPHFVYSIEVAETGEVLPEEVISLKKRSSVPKSGRPFIVGSGPAGLFAALRFVERGIPCVLFERGSESGERMKGINRFWRHGQLDPRNNVCFGEGGAGLYSDGKLITRIKSPHIPYVLDRLVQFGAPEEIKWLANPHVGSDKIRRVIPKMREYLKAHGCEIRFNTRIDQLVTEGEQVVGVLTEQGEKLLSPAVILATGHSADDTLNHLREIGVHLEGKSFAMGLRVEHPQKVINQLQYRQFAEHPKLGSANYKLTHHDHKTGIGVYSFCMCPGGYVLSSGTEGDGLVCNGMSNYNRNSPYANAAMVVSIDFEKNFGNDLWGGMELRRNLEQKAFKEVQRAGGTRELPVQGLSDFLNGHGSKSLPPCSSPSGVLPTRLDTLLPAQMTEKLREGLVAFEKSMRGFFHPDALLYGVESRTSCPLRITRDEETLQSLSHKGLYPAGEGAGYAGGITSAACDGVRVADRIFEVL